MKRFAVERVEALFNRGELDRVEEFVTEDFVNHEAWPGEDPGYELPCLSAAAPRGSRTPKDKAKLALRATRVFPGPLSRAPSDALGLWGFGWLFGFGGGG